MSLCSGPLAPAAAPGPSQPCSPPGSSSTTRPCTCPTSVRWRPWICGEVGRPGPPATHSSQCPPHLMAVLSTHTCTRTSPASPPPTPRFSPLVAGRAAWEEPAGMCPLLCFRLCLCLGRGPPGAGDQNLEGEHRGQTGECGRSPRPGASTVQGPGLPSGSPFPWPLCSCSGAWAQVMVTACPSQAGLWVLALLGGPGHPGCPSV